jgi:non-specific serine/threonine protein kinase
MPLTRREREVAALIARGYTNREISASMVISERTAATHVEHMLAKLQMTSRAQIATWATERLVASNK